MNSGRALIGAPRNDAEPMRNLITDVPGIKVGHGTDLRLDGERILVRHNVEDLVAALN